MEEVSTIADCFHNTAGSFVHSVSVQRYTCVPHFLDVFRLTNEVTALSRIYHGTSFLGGGSKFVVILATNQGGGVMEWKNPRQWAIERNTIRNKHQYTQRWGYHLELVDMTMKKRYAHEWRESWEKVDNIRNAMKKYPNAEWCVGP